MTAPADRSRDSEDARLMLLVAEGDAEAYRRLVSRHAAPLRRFAQLLLGNAADAEDVVQETFLKLWLCAAGNAPTAHVSTWLYRVTHNRAVDRLRAHAPFEALETEDQIASGAELASTLLATKRENEALELALNALPPRQRTAVALVYLNGLSDREASEVLETTEPALESLLSRARRNLKTLLGATRRTSNGDSQ